MSKPKVAPPPIRSIVGRSVPPPQTRLVVVQRAAAVTFAATKRPPAIRRSGEAAELMNLPDGSYRLRSLDRGTLAPANGVYNFVRVYGLTRNDVHLYASANLPHAVLAQGQAVIYAGTAKLDAGRLEWWSNYSGTYQPIAELREQAKLPVDKFMPWQKLQLGGTSMQRNTFTDRTAKAAPESKRSADKAEVAKPGKPANDTRSSSASTSGKSSAAAAPKSGAADKR